MSLFSDEGAAELRAIYFESAHELLQTLNEEGLHLEKQPTDIEIIRSVRRTVHTMKGDSAACGFRELSELAHELEDVLTPEVAARTGSRLAQLVLNAADVFEAMLAAYRDSLQPPDGSGLRQLIHALIEGKPDQRASCFAPGFAWTEYQRLLIGQGAGGRPLFNVAVGIDPQTPFRAAGVQLIKNVLQQAGTLLTVKPEDTQDSVEVVEAVIASELDRQTIERKCVIPAVVSEVVVQPYTTITDDASSGTAEAEISNSSLPAEFSAPSPVDPVQAEESAPSAPHPIQETTLRVDAERIDTVLNLVGELIITKSMLHQAVDAFARRFPKDSLRTRLTDVLAHQVRVLDELQRSVMKIRMVPVEQLFRRFPRVIRDVSRITGKPVALELSGQETDLDKSILDALAEPITHLVRNAVDHGIEPPEARATAGKSAQGTVRLNAYHQGNQVVIEVSDDGRGIDRQQVASKALKNGLILQDELAEMTETDVLDLVFEPGFSTADTITEVSGRGVGLDVVKTVLGRLKGSVSVITRPGEGTTFQLRVPLTLAIIKALLFRAGERLFAIPLGSVLEITRATESEIHRVDNHDVLQLREEVITLVRLNRLGTNAARKGRNRLFIVVVAMGERKYGLVVDELVGEEELVIKALDSHLVSSELISGASILGDGTVVLVLNVASVIEKVGRTRGARSQSVAGRGAMLAAEAKA